MGLSEALGRIAVRHAHVLVAEVPGHWLTRAAVERHVLARGWRLALSPADADILAVCGPPCPHLSEPLHRLWEQLPGPRARIQLESPQAVLPALLAAEQDLLDLTRQRADSRDRSPDHAAPGQAQPGERHPHEGHAPHEAHGHDHSHERPHCGAEHADHGGGDGGHAGHGGMGHAGMAHGGMDMAPGGIPLAGGGEDRDGLEMDLLHLRLGPVLAYWPAGLVLRCTLQGDAIVDAETSLVGVDDPAAPAQARPASEDPRRFAARRCDNAASLLGLAGWDHAASRARRIRDALLFTEDRDGPARELHRLRRMVGRSRSLRWSLRRVGPLDVQQTADRDLPDAMTGDVRDRLLAMLDRAAGGIAGQRPTGPSSGVPVDAIPDLVRGWDLATARLIVASLDLDPLVVDREVTHA
ncbi:hypothetical protein V6U81_20705 [Micromonospora sp. CPCC 205711]|uniref:hypothetical protein n=1 Tax=Micromonospora sp. CPCC 205547 TaxID=3122400 RepID=UPI002FF41465